MKSFDTSLDGERLYQLLPAAFRMRDADQGYPLRALIEVLASQAQIAEADIARLYENWFIETCEEWVVPYLGDLLRVHGLLPKERAGWSQRALVANTLRYRQRKGTAPLLEQLVHDVTGWAARVVELYGVLGVTQHLEHVRPGQGGTAELRRLPDSSLVGSAFDPFCYSADVRLMSGTRQLPQVEAERIKRRTARQTAGVGTARPSLSNIGLYIWRLRPYRMVRATACRHVDKDNGKSGARFSFSPIGGDIRLFNAPESRRDFSGFAREHELPVALRNAALIRELEERSASLNENREPAPGFLSGPAPAFEIYCGRADEPVGMDRIIVDSLDQWDDPASMQIRIENLSRRHSNLEGKIIVDPEKGRLYFPPGSAGSKGNVRVSYSYAFSDSIGGGPYDRRSLIERGIDTVADPAALGHVIQTGEPEKEGLFPLEAGLAQWEREDRPAAVIRIGGNHTSSVTGRKKSALQIRLGSSQLVIQAANLCRPAIIRDIDIVGEAATAELTLSGLLIAGRIVVNGPVAKLNIVDCTCLPGGLTNKGVFQYPKSPALTVTDAQSLQIRIERSIVGPLLLPDSVMGLSVSDSIIDAGIAQGKLAAVAGRASGRSQLPGPPARLERVTVFGDLSVRKLELAENVLFTDSIMVEEGVLRNCYFPETSGKARAVLASGKIRIEHCLTGSGSRIPAFTSRSYGEPGYAQLSLACPPEIRTGGTGGSEIGVFHRLYQPQREGALLAQLEEYLRFGLEAGLVYVNY